MFHDTVFYYLPLCLHAEKNLRVIIAAVTVVIFTILIPNKSRNWWHHITLAAKLRIKNAWIIVKVIRDSSLLK
jgi:hypothetical protein